MLTSRLCRHRAFPLLGQSIISDFTRHLRETTLSKVLVPCRLPSSVLSQVYQALDLTATPGRWYNVIDASPLGVICLEADLSTEAAYRTCDK